MTLRFMKMEIWVRRSRVARIGGRQGGDRDRTWITTNIERISQRLRFVLERIPRPERVQAKTIARHIVKKAAEQVHGIRESGPLVDIKKTGSRPWAGGSG